DSGTAAGRPPAQEARRAPHPPRAAPKLRPPTRSGPGLRDPAPRRYLDAGTELVISFTGIPDGLHHAFWAFHDPGSPVHEPGAPAALRTIIERWYAEIDTAIGRLSAACDERTAVVVLSDHGGGPAPVRHANRNPVLPAAGR